MRQNIYKEVIVQNDSLGKVHIDYTEDKIDENNIGITKKFNKNDYLEIEVPDLETPDINYERVTIVENNSGLAQEGSMEYNFEIGKKIQTEEPKLQSTDGEELFQNLDLLGQIKCKISSAFWIISPTEEDHNIAKEIFRYRNKGYFTPKRLSSQIKSKIIYGDGEETDFDIVDFDQEDKVIELDEQQIINTTEPDIQYADKSGYLEENIDQQEKQNEKLSSSSPILSTNNKRLASATILGNKIAVYISYDGYADKSIIKAQIKVGRKVITDFIKKTFDHCVNHTYQKNYSKKYKFFEAEYVVYGMITLPISASGLVNYGYTVKSQKGYNNCSISITPNINIGLYADGQVSMAQVIKAGIYTSGTFLDTKVTLKAEAQGNQLTASIYSEFYATKFEFGATYSLYQCQPQTIFTRKLSQVENNESQIQEISLKREKLKLWDIIKKGAEETYNAGKKVYSTAKKVYKPVQKFIKPATDAAGFLIDQSQKIFTKFIDVCDWEKGKEQIYSRKSDKRERQLYRKTAYL